MPRLEALENRTLPSIDVLSSFAGLDYRDGGHFRPPDTIAAVGPNHIVEMINSQIAFLDKTTGVRLFQQTLNDFFAPVLAPDPYAGDPVVAYDEQAHRFFVGALDFGHDTFRTGREESFFYFAVSNTANPLDGFSEMHRIDVKRIFGGAPRVADFPRIGWNADAYVLSFRMFSFPFSTQVFSHMQILTIDKSTVLDVDSATLTKYHVDQPAGTAQNLTPAIMHGAVPGGPMWFVLHPAAAASSLSVTRMDNVLSPTPTFTNTPLAVAPYGAPPFATQLGGGAMQVGATRPLNAAWRDNRLVVSQRGAESGGVSRARWYEFSTSDPDRPVLTQSGEINQGPGVHTYYPAIEIAANGDLGLTFMQSSPNEYVSMYVTGRKPTDPLGVMRPPVLVKAGEAPLDALDASPHDMSGDYAGLTVDPVTGTFWAAHEYATGATTGTNWGTWVAEFSLADPAGAWVTAGSPSETVVAPSVQSLTFTFSEPMDTASFSLAEDVALFTGPGGADLLTQLLVWGSFRWSPDGRVLTVSFPAQAAFGPYALVLGPQIRRASDSSPLDQNGNGLPGEVPGDRYTAAFTLNSLGPDGFGYAAHLHPFEAIGLVPGAPGVFTILDNVNDGVARLDLGANAFNFYGTVYRSLFVNSNGLITLGSGVSSGANQNGFIAPVQHMIALLWDDWRTDLDANDQVLGKYEDTDGDGVPDRLILEWHQVRHAPTSPLAVTFQAILGLNTGANASDIVFNYPNLNTGDANANGASATVGIKDQGAQGGNQVRVSFNALSPFVGSGNAIHFSAPPIGGEIRGQVFHDRNRNGTHDPGEPGLADWAVYLDLDGNGRQDADEPFTQTDASGNYAITGVVPGGYTARAERQRGWVRSPVAGSRVLEGFESGRLGVYQAVGATFGSALVLADAAHGDGLGLCDNCLLRSGTDWIFRNDAAVQVAQGDTISVWLQLANTADGRAHFGFGATPLGTLSLVVAADTNELLLQENLGYDAAGPVLGAVPQTYQPNQWYRLEVEWGTDGSIIGRLFDSDGVTLLSTVMGSSSVIAAGGIAFRATGGQKYWDTVTASNGGSDGRTLYVGPRQAVVGKDFGFSLDVIDNQDGCFEVIGHGWRTVAGGYRGDYLAHAPGRGRSVARWSFVLEPETSAELFVTWVAGVLHARNAQYRIFDGDTLLAVVTVDQRIRPGDLLTDGTWWHSLGMYHTATGRLTIELSDRALGLVVADAAFVDELST